MIYQKRLILYFLTIILLLISIGCSNPNQSEQNSTSQLIRYNICAEPETLDPIKATGLPEGTIMLQLFDGLTRYNAQHEISPGIAESWDISSDGLTYTFKLRDAKWSNGDPLKAQDFVYSWLRVLNPENASEYAYQMYYIVGAEEYNSGTGKKESVGIKALDEKTLQVILKAPTPQFLSLTSFYTYYPLHEKSVENNKAWFTDSNNLVCNGPFKMVSWDHNQKMILQKNPHYWDNAQVKLDHLEVYFVDSLNTGYEMFQAGQLDFQNEVPVQELASLKASRELVIMPDASIYFYRFNTNNRPFDDIRVRKALALAINREQLVEQVTKGGQKPAYAFVPNGLKILNGQDYREVGGDLLKENLTEAKNLLAQAGFPEGKGFPTVNLLFNSNEDHKKIAEAIQHMWKKNLGIEISLANSEWQVYRDRVNNMDYDLVRSAWTPDYLDPMTFMDVFVSDGGNNCTGWGNKEYDQLIHLANSTSDQSKRIGNMHQAEKILLEEMPIMPIYFYTRPVLLKENIKGVIIPPFATYADFKHAYVE